MLYFYSPKFSKTFFIFISFAALSLSSEAAFRFKRKGYKGNTFICYLPNFFKSFFFAFLVSDIAIGLSSVSGCKSSMFTNTIQTLSEVFCVKKHNPLTGRSVKF